MSNLLTEHKSRLLDLFCGAGGAGTGYSRAGFEVTGVDNRPQKNYPFKFIQGDAIEYALAHGHEFDALHASPPCQHFSVITRDKNRHIDLIPQTRAALIASGKPYVIENVMGAVRELRAPIVLCGMVFGLKVYRHRAFESNILLLAPPHWPHRDRTPGAGNGISPNGFISITSGGNRATAKLQIMQTVDHRRRGSGSRMSAKDFISLSGHISGIDYCRMAMGIDRMTGKELVQAVPPVYTEYIGAQLMDYLH